MRHNEPQEDRCKVTPRRHRPDYCTELMHYWAFASDTYNSPRLFSPSKYSTCHEMDPEKGAEKSLTPLKQRDKEYYELNFSKAGLPPGTDSLDQLDKNPRLPRPPATQKRPCPPLPPTSERKGKWLEKYLDTVRAHYQECFHRY